MRVERVVKDVNVSLGKVLDALANNLTLEENLRARLISVTTPGAPDTEFTIQHNLGVKPKAYIWNVDKNAVVYDSRRVDWTTSQMFLKCTAASAKLYLVIL